MVGHWEWFAVNRTGTGVKEDLFKLGKIKPMRTIPDLSFEEMLDVKREYQKDFLTMGICQHRNWTFVNGSGMFFVRDVTKVSRKLGADACVTLANPGENAFFFEYAKPDGTYRFKFYHERDEFPVHRKVVWEEEEEDYVWVMEVEGRPLTGEPTDIVIDNEDALAEVLEGVGVPIGQLYEHIYRYKTERHLPDEKEQIFTSYLAPWTKKSYLRSIKRHQKKDFTARYLGLQTVWK